MPSDAPHPAPSSGQGGAAPRLAGGGPAARRRVLWWPVGFWGLTPWLHLPLDALEGDVLLLGATAAAASVSLARALALAPLRRSCSSSAGSGGCSRPPPSTRYPRRARGAGGPARRWRPSSASCSAPAGTRARSRAATVLAVVAGLSPATWPHGLPLAVALALPFAVATWQRVAPTLLSVARILLTWLVFALLARSLSYGWDVLAPGMQAGSQRAEAAPRGRGGVGLPPHPVVELLRGPVRSTSGGSSSPWCWRCWSQQRGRCSAACVAGQRPRGSAHAERTAPTSGGRRR